MKSVESNVTESASHLAQMVGKGADDLDRDVSHSVLPKSGDAATDNKMEGLSGPGATAIQDLDHQIDESPIKTKIEDGVESPSHAKKTNVLGLVKLQSRSISQLEKVSEEDWDSPKRPRAVNKAKEADNSDDESDGHSSSEEDTESLNQAIKSLTSTDKGTDKDTKQTDESMPAAQDVIDVVSIKSRYSKNCFETASVKKSIVSSKMSRQDKK